MDFHNSSTVIIALIVSNIVSLFILWCSWKKPGIARFLFFLLFTWASFTNGSYSLTKPQVYIEYADFALLSMYKNFILGFFSQHITILVFTVAVSQFLIGVSMLMKGIIFRAGCWGGIIFLISILPLGVGAACPATLIIAAGLFLLQRKNISNYLWQDGAKKLS